MDDLAAEREAVLNQEGLVLLPPPDGDTHGEGNIGESR